MVKLFALLALTAHALVAAQNYQDLHKLGVNFAIPADTNWPELAQKAASMGVVRIKLFGCDDLVVYQLRKHYAFASRKLEIMVMMPQWVAKPPTGNPESPLDWKAVKACTKVVKDNKDIVTGVFVFNEPCAHGLCFGADGSDFLSVLGYYAEALKDDGMQISAPFSSPCLMPMTPAKIPFFQTVVRILQKTKSPITINLYPYLDYVFKPFNIPIDHALGSEGPYGKLIEWSQIDMDIARVRGDMAKLGPEFKDTPVQVGESGWAHAYGDYPTSGGDLARKQKVFAATTYDYSNSFYLNLVKRLHTLGLEGIYIFELAEEPMKPVIFPAYEAEKHFGISGLYKNSSEAPWHIDDPSRHEPWTGFATMRPEDWKRFDDEQAGLEVAVKQNPNDTNSAQQLRANKAGAEKLKADNSSSMETVQQQLLRARLKGEAYQRVEHLKCTPANKDTHDNAFSSELPCCKDLQLTSIKCRETDMCEFCMPVNTVMKWQKSALHATALTLSWADYAAGVLAAVTCIAGVVALLRRGRSQASVLEFSIEEPFETALETAALE